MRFEKEEDKMGFALFWPDVRSDLSGCVHGMDIFSDFAT